MADSRQSEEPMADPDIRQKEPTYVHNVRQIVRVLPMMGSLAVGVLGLLAFAVGFNHTDNQNSGSLWLIGGSIGLIASGIGCGVLGWIVWSK